MKALFVDDDVTYGEFFLRYMKVYCRELELRIDCDVYSDAGNALDHAENYDIYFLDIELGETSGLSLAEELRERFAEKEIIFISFYEEYAFSAFRVKPLAFIRKSKFEKDLFDALTLVKQRVYEKYAPLSIRLNCKNVLKVIPENILYCQSIGHYVHFKDQKEDVIIGRVKLDQVEEAMAEYGFIRVHASYLVNEAYIVSVKADKLKLKSGQEISISRAYTKEVYKRIFDI